MRISKGKKMNIVLILNYYLEQFNWVKENIICPDHTQSWRKVRTPNYPFSEISEHLIRSISLSLSTFARYAFISFCLWLTFTDIYIYICIYTKCMYIPISPWNCEWRQLLVPRSVGSFYFLDFDQFIDYLFIF